MPRPISIYSASGQAFSELPRLLSCDVLSGLKEFSIAFMDAVSASEQIILRARLVNALSSRVVQTVAGRAPAPLASSNVVISQRTKELKELGCLEVSSVYHTVDDQPKKATRYKILTLAPLVEHLLSEPRKSPAPQGRPRSSEIRVYKDSFTGKGLINLEAGGVRPYSEGAFSILGSAAYTHTSRFEESPTVRYHIRQGDHISIQVSTSTRPDAQVMRPSDQRAIISLNGMLRKFRNSPQGDMFLDRFPAAMIDGYCFYDLYALTKEMGLQENVKSNRDRVLVMMNRLKDTVFSVDAKNSKFWRERYLPAGMTHGEYRYITEFYSSEEFHDAHPNKDGAYERAGQTKRFFVVKFHPLIMAAMFDPTNGDSFIVHEALKAERMDIPHQLNNFVKAVVGVRDMGRPIDHHQYPLDILHQRVAPGTRLDLFTRDFFNLARRQTLRAREAPQPHCVPFKLTADEKSVAEGEGGIFLLNGYYYKVEYNKALADELYRKKRYSPADRRILYPVVTIWRDREDYLVGDNSDHNQALRRQMNELLSHDD